MPIEMRGAGLLHITTVVPNDDPWEMNQWEVFSLRRGPLRDMKPMDSAEALLYSCTGCDEHFPEDEMVQAHHGPYSIEFSRYCEGCDHNTYTCEACDVIFDDNWAGMHNVHNEILCGGCFSDSYYWCNSCDTVLSHDDGDGEYCNNCQDQEEDDGVIHDYSYKPRAIFFSVPSDAKSGAPAFTVAEPYFGVELEVEATGAYSPSEIAERFLDTMNGGTEAYYAKHDGSLSWGVELVSHPRTLASWQALGDQLADALATISSMGGKAWERSSTGLHVHMDRRAFNSQGHIGRFAYIIASNQPGMVEFCGRDASYASFDGLRQGGAVKKAIGQRSGSHSDAVNFWNSATVEVRTFRSSLAGARVLGAIELVHALTQYTATMTTRDIVLGASSWDSIKEWVIENKTTYPNASYIFEGNRFKVGRTIQDNYRYDNVAKGDKECV